MGGKLLLFQAGAASLGIGKARPQRDNPAFYGTDKEAALRNPEDPFYKRFAAECSRVQLTVDVFCGAPGPADLASLAAIPRYTCGDVHYYPGASLSLSLCCARRAGRGARVV